MIYRESQLGAALVKVGPGEYAVESVWWHM